MLGKDAESIVGRLCQGQKLERDRAMTELMGMVPSLSPDIIVVLKKSLLDLVVDTSSPWESIHGSLLGLRVIILKTEMDSQDQFCVDSRQAAIKNLTHTEVRVRQAAGEVLGALCTKDGGVTYNSCRSCILEMVRNNLERQVTDDEASKMEHESTRQLMEKLSAGTRERRNSGDAAQIFHDTAGWRNLETSMKALEQMITGSGNGFLPYIDQELLDLIFTALVHTNRFVRETGFSVCAALVSSGMNVSETAELMESNPMIMYGDQLATHLGQGLADNWSQVRLASSVACRKFLMFLPTKARERFFSVLLPRMCLNRYYVAEGVRLYSQETWRQVAGTEGKLLVEKYIDSVVSYYTEATTADNHAVREAACACIAELASKISVAAVAPHVSSLLSALTICFQDDSWPVRDAACIACGNFILCFPEQSKPSMETLYPLFFTNLQDNIPSVRQGAATALTNVVQAYEGDALTVIIEKLKQGLGGVESQASDCERYGDLEKSPALYGVVKRRRDNDQELHTDKQMYSCGSLAPKMGRGGGGGCSDCKFRRPPQLWEYGDGCIYLVAELSHVPCAQAEVIKILPLMSSSVRHKHYTAHVTLLETLCKILPALAKGLGKRGFKSHLQLFIDAIFYSLECENALTSSAASQCLTSLSQFLGPNILRGRIEEYNPNYLRALDANIYMAPL